MASYAHHETSTTATTTTTTIHLLNEIASDIANSPMGGSPI